MLSLETPPMLIGGVLLFADHLSADTYYFAAPNPKIAVSGGRLMFDIFAYSVELEHSPLAGTTIPAELGAGFLTMGAECKLDQATHDRVLTELANHLDRDRDGLTLSPIPYTKGTVSVIALDAASGAAAAPTPATTPGRPTFVEKIVGGGPPSLLGDLRSIFSLSLSQEGVAFLQGLYTDNAAPIGIVYDLKFLGLRPSVQCEIHANVSKIYTEFGGKASVGCAYVRAEVEGTISKLRQQGDITIKMTSQAMGDEAVKGEELAMSLFKEKIIQELFNPGAVPKLPNIPNMPGANAQSTSIVTLSLKARSDEELRTIDFDFSLRAPEERTHAPQAFLGAVLTKEEMAQHLHQVDLASDFFEKLEVLVTGPSAEEFSALGLRSATVDITYGQPGDPVPPDTQTLLFRPGGPGDLPYGAKRNGRHSLAYSYVVTYEFDRSGSVDTNALTYQTPPRTRTGRTVSIRPYDDLTVVDVEVENGRLPADVTTVDLALDYADAATRFTAHQDFRLPTATVLPRDQRRWQVRAAGAKKLSYTAKATLTFADPATYELPPTTSDSSLFRVDAPFTANRTLLIQPNVSSPDLRSITVEIDYHDEPAKYQRRFVHTLQATTLAAPAAPVDGTPLPATPVPAAPAVWLPLTVSWPILAPDRQEFKYRVTTSAGGIVDAGDWLTTTEPSLLVGEVGARSRTVDVRLIGPPLADAGIDGVAVRIGATGSQDVDAVSLFFEPGGLNAMTTIVPAGPDAPPGFRYQVTSFRADGTQRVSGWLASPTNLIALSTRTI